jgi:hypothetical protein
MIGGPAQRFQTGELADTSPGDGETEPECRRTFPRGILRMSIRFVTESDIDESEFEQVTANPPAMLPCFRPKG